MLVLSKASKENYISTLHNMIVNATDSILSVSKNNVMTHE